MFVVAYNKDLNNENTLDVLLINNNDNLSIKGNIDVYGVDSNGLSYIGTVSPNNNGFSLDLPKLVVRLAVVTL